MTVYLIVWFNYNQHLKTCANKVCEIFPGGIYRIPPAIYKNLDDICISIPPQDCHFPFFSCFDFECYFFQENIPKNSSKITYQANHIPMSVAISSNVPEEEKAVCFISEGKESNLVKKMLHYLEKLSD